MPMTPKLSDALRHLAAAPNGRIGRAHKGFGFTGVANAPLITRRTANALVCAGLADYNDRWLPSTITMTEKGRVMARTVTPMPNAASAEAEIQPAMAAA